MAIKSCYGCVAPKRHPGCHDHCPEYLAEKAESDKQREKRFKANVTKAGLYQQRTRAVENAIRKRKKIGGSK